jgi:hypothetical protein
VILSSALAINCISCTEETVPTGFIEDFEKASYTEQAHVQIRQIGNWEYDSGMALLAFPGYGEFSVSALDLPGKGKLPGRLTMLATFSKNDVLNKNNWEVGFKLGHEYTVEVQLNHLGHVSFIDSGGNHLTSIPESRQAIDLKEWSSFSLKIEVFDETNHSIVATLIHSNNELFLAASDDIPLDFDKAEFNTSVFIKGQGTGYLALDYWQIWPNWVTPD